MYLTPSKYLSNIHVIKSIMEGTTKKNIQRLPYLYTIDERTLEFEVILHIFLVTFCKTK
jgi:hypothetical protein